MEGDYEMSEVDWAFVDGVLALEEYMDAVIMESEPYMEIALCNYKSCERKYKAMTGEDFPEDVRRDFATTHSLDRKIITRGLEKNMELIDEIGNDDVCLDFNLTPRNFYVEQGWHMEEGQPSFIDYRDFN